MTFIMIFIVIANIIAIALTYISLGKMESKRKLIYIVIGFALMYLFVLLIYSLNSGKIANKEVADSVKDLIVFTFVPVNSMIVLPFLAKSYQNYTEKKIEQNQLKNRMILISIGFVVILIFEFFYFGNIQNGIINLMKTKKENVQTNTMVNEMANNEIKNVQTENGMNEVVNQIYNQTR